MAFSEALLELGRALQTRSYRFTTVTPATHARVLANARRAGRAEARDLRDIFGWNFTFDTNVIERPLLELLQGAGMCDEQQDGLRSRVRFSSMHDRLFVHSAYPTLAADAVFFGPDTHRFCNVVTRWLERDRRRYRRVVDVGCGSGAGGVLAEPWCDRVLLTDINASALAFARVNAALAEVRATVACSDVLRAVTEPFDLVIANPPYLRDPQARMYREGGGRFGEGLSLRIVEEALNRLAAGGTLMLYTGTAIVDGRDVFWDALEHVVGSRDVDDLEYVELDPDVFGEELERPEHAAVDRFAAVALRIQIA